MKLYSFFNLGNTCYLNSILQCLLNDPNFKENLKVCDKNRDLIKLLNDIQIDLTQPDIKLFKHYNLTDMINFFGKKFPRFQQHDAHEFLLEFLDKLNYPKFTGKIKTNIVCSICKTVSTKFEDFTTIDLYIQKNNLFENFMDYLKKEEIHGYTCEKCKCAVTATKKSYLYTINDYIVIVLKKYTLKTKMEYPKNNLKIRETESGEVYTYKLHAVIYHLGNNDNGHYNCSVLIHGEWYFMDDEKIILKDSMNETDENSYILFYKRIKS
jgi:ubiquitin C-terminal hydrolase